MSDGVDRQDLPFEETSRRPRGLPPVSWTAWERLYRHVVAVAEGEVPETIRTKSQSKATYDMAQTGP